MTVRQDLTIRQGETWEKVLTALDSSGAALDLSGYTGRGAIRQYLGGPLEVYFSTGSDARNGTMALGGAAGTITLSMTAAETSDLGGEISYWALTRHRVGPFLRMMYDLELIDGAGAVSRAFTGWVIVERGVTE